MKLTTIQNDQLRRGRVIGIAAGKYVVQVGKGTVNARGSGFSVGDSVVVSKVSGVFQIISKFKPIAKGSKEIFIPA